MSLSFNISAASIIPFEALKLNESITIFAINRSPFKLLFTHTSFSII
jgi:hypothetical protein